MSHERTKRTPRRIRVHVVHESRMMAEAISVKLKSALPGASVDGWTKSWHTYLNRAQGVADVVLLDNELGDGGPTSVKVRTLARSGTGIVVLGGSEYAPAIRRVLAAGAHSYMVADEGSTSIAAAIAAAFRGETYESELLGRILGAHEATPVPELTARELEIVSMYLSGPGASVPETAERFGLSAETVRTHISHARRKYAGDDLTAVSKMELRRRMIRDGWILE
ncbi:hypothetical protein B7R21_03790 [Subtercola boreus]|uniref:HTH luxR-type domain-containing protein n=1 Tax=Subtercola boreus TaxID=120213 RepID=A0A3E0VZX8_9MICO|nr:sigma factor-like helix-turn-helix DNA-binding protein [Subtercola boreus]RFA15165.1 hypothetical protein B7R21_03790 [Subtercola boreus]